jgi:hypothetical protein
MSKNNLKGTVIDGDRYALCLFPFSMQGRAMSLESHNDLGELCSKIPDHVEGDGPLSVCEVIDGRWIHFGDPTDTNPLKVRTLYEVTFHENPSEDDDED